MVQDEKGLFSRCICPNCLQTCAACLGTAQQPLSPEALHALVSERARYDRDLAETPGETSLPHLNEVDRLGD